MQVNRFKENMKTLNTGLREIHSLQHWVLPVTIFDALFKSISPFINIYITAKIIDELLGAKDIERFVLLVGLTIGLNFIIHLISTGLDHLRLFLRNIVIQNQDMKMNEKIINMDYEHVENPVTHNLRTKISEAEMMNSGGIIALLKYLGDFAKGLITVITSIVLVAELFKYNNSIGGYIFLALVLVGTIFNLYLKTKADKKMFEYFSGIMDLNRIFTFYFTRAEDYNAGKEIRLYNQKHIYKKEIDSFIQGGSNMFKKIENTNGKYGGIGAFISSLIGGMVYIFIGLRAIGGSISVGSIVQYTGSINQFISGSTLVLTSINNIMNNNQYLQLYIDFLNIEGEKYKGTLPVEKRDDDEYEIEFRNVSFKYPGTDEYVLRNVSIELNIGERLAIVGMNGSGKTTFIKLLCRLYDPDEGEILLNGIDIKKYDYEEYMNLFSIVFQDFKLFSFSLGQNVAASVNYDEMKVESVLEKAGFNERVSTMSKGIQTPLYKDFDEDGVEISGGEAQKIALARALYRDAPIIILDEPTAALDPIAEFEIYSKFNEIVGTKTAFYISHRLSSCRFCDEIAVFHEGRIIQKGTHEALLKNEEGKYYELWHSQAVYYNDVESA